MGAVVVAAQVGQLVFGYDDGHRLLAGSVSLPPPDVSLLLGATDAPPHSDNEGLLTGLRLPGLDAYALCVTWSAPEISRPGAVWSHVLVLEDGLLTSLEEPLALLSLAQRPTPERLEKYAKPLDVPNQLKSIDRPDRTLLARYVSAAYGGSERHVVIEQDLTAAVAAIGLIWRNQWPSLRSHFSFRTRDSVRGDSAQADLVVARRIRGTKRPLANQASQRWVFEVVTSILTPSATPLTAFIREFGPKDRPEPATYGSLARIYEMVSRGSTSSVRKTIEAHYPSPTSGTDLKRALFGHGEPRPWSGSEVDRVLSLLGATTDAWDVQELQLADRTAKVLAETNPSAVSHAVASKPASSVRSSVVEALTVRSAPSNVPVFIGAHRDIVAEWVKGAPSVLEQQPAWVDLTPRDATWLLHVIPDPTPRLLVAALRAGHVEAVREAAGPIATLRALASSGDFALAKRVLATSDRDSLTATELSPREVLLAAAVWPRSEQRGRLLAALEREREDPDDVWLRTAVEVLASGKNPSESLPVVFGPLHESMTADRLPRECWQLLDPVLPPASDPALRLRRYLLHIAQTSEWPVDTFARAIRDAGPYTGELLHEFRDEDDWWVVAARAIVRAAAGLFGH